VALKLGASGIFLKSETPDRLIQAIRLIGNDGIWVDKKIVQMLADQFIDRYPQVESEKPASSLDILERQVLLGIVEGQTNRRIGERLGLSESKIKNTVQRLFGRAGVNTRGQLVRAALDGSLDVGQTFVARHQYDTGDSH
jgi:two-component system nitrate/nitrite response regulator NarL